MVTIVLASHNKGKLTEIQDKMKELPITLCPQTDFDIPEYDETGLTYIENAIGKARHTARLTNLPTIADDSGLSVDYLNGAPGIYSARYAGIEATDESNNNKLLTAMKNVKEEKRRARFHCTIVLLRHAEDPSPLICQGRWDGTILTAPRGKNGFGYDPLFYVPTHQCSSAELSRDIKNTISHRAQALDCLVHLLQQNSEFNPI